LKYGIAVPGLLSLLVHDDVDAPVLGLDKFRREHWPPLGVSFASYHVMIALGTYFIALTLFASWLRWRQTLFTKRWLLWVFVVSVVGPFIANEVGWVAADVGRQPWVVHPRMVRDGAGNIAFDSAGFVMYRQDEGLLTRDAVSESITGGEVIASIVMFGVIYSLLFFIWVYVLNSKIQAGPKPVRIHAGTAPGDVLAAAARRTLHRGSMSEAKESSDRSDPPSEGAR
jgi:cytochrome d ubiquinol oxidase subunit I